MRAVSFRVSGLMKAGRVWQRPRFLSLQAPRITLWHAPDARSLRCMWTMEEMGMHDYKLITMPFPPRVFHREFLKTNVLGTIPYFEDGDAAMTESCGICEYLVARYGSHLSLSIGPAMPDYASYVNWLHHADATLTFPQTIVLRYTVLEAGKCDKAAIDYAKWYLARLRLLDNTLADGREYLVGGRFTVADICVAYALYVAQAFALNLDGIPLVERYKPQTREYMQRLLQRPAFKKCLVLQEKSLQKFKENLLVTTRTEDE